MFITLCKIFKLIILYLHMTPKKSIFSPDKFKVNPIFTQEKHGIIHTSAVTQWRKYGGFYITTKHTMYSIYCDNIHV